MLNFIVLGYVPGTSIQINFIQYITGVVIMLAALFAVGYIEYRISKRKFVQTLHYTLPKALKIRARQNTLAV